MTHNSLTSLLVRFETEIKHDNNVSMKSATKFSTNVPCEVLINPAEIDEQYPGDEISHLVAKMIITLAIALIAIPCLAVEPGQTSLFGLGYQSTSSINSMFRWLELHGQIYDYYPSKSLSLPQIKSLLDEMSTIEKTEAFKADLKPFIQMKKLRVNDYQALVDRSYEEDLLDSRDATMTDLLLRTFDHELNDCTSDYLELLDDINVAFAQSSMSLALKANRRSQYANCWQRFMDILRPSSELFGSEVRSNLNNIARRIYPTAAGIVISQSHQSSAQRRVESMRLAEIIADFLRNDGDEMNVIDYFRQFRRLVLKPCELLIDTTSHVMTHIYAMLALSGTQRNFIRNDHTLILNRYMLCDRIIADRDFISSSVMRYTGTHDWELLEPTNPNLDKSAIPVSPAIGNNSFDLITQQFPVLPDSSEPVAKRPRISEPSTNIEWALARPANPMKRGKKVVKIFEGVGKGRGAKYPTYWTDKSITREYGSYLKKHWPNEWRDRETKSVQKNLARAQGVSTKAKLHYPNKDVESRIVESLGLSSQDPQVVYSENLAEPASTWVVEVRRGIGRGKHALYPAIWSDGSASLESKEYLEREWYEAWIRLMRRMRSARKNRWWNKKKNEPSRENKSNHDN